MTPFEALELSEKFPKNRTVPKRIYDAFQEATATNKKKFENIIEGMYVTAVQDEDFELLNKYFANQVILKKTEKPMPASMYKMGGKKKKKKKGGKK